MPVLPTVTPTPIPINRLIDVTVSLYNNPTTSSQRAPYEEIIRYFADGVYESSNGAHKLGTVTIYPNKQNFSQSHIQWIENCQPNAHISGYPRANSGNRVEMCDKFIYEVEEGKFVLESNFLKELENGGYTLAHEWGHYFYSLYDEYRGRESCDVNDWLSKPCNTDTPVQNSIMNSQWNARGDNYAWLNFSTALNNTENTAQHRMYAASGWETLARPTNLDPRNGSRKFLPKRLYYSELARVAPAYKQAPRIDLITGHTARSELQIIWASNAATGIPQETDVITAHVESLSGDMVTYPKPIEILAVLHKNQPIAKASTYAEIQSSDGTTETFVLRDDGITPDYLANDGLYSAIVGYQQSGTYTISVRFNNSAGIAEETYEGMAFAPPPEGVTVTEPAPIPVTEPFDMVVEQRVDVVGVQPDSHGDTPQDATDLLPDNNDVPGRIDTSGDKDVFKITADFSGTLIVRVSDVTAGMQPSLRLLAADGHTELAEGYVTNPSQEGHLFLSYPIQIGDVIYVELSHVDTSATDGFYNISAGESLSDEQQMLDKQVDGIILQGAMDGLVNETQVFTSSTYPFVRGLVITYTWAATNQNTISQTGTLSDTVAFTWAVTGTKYITVTADNGVGKAVTATHTIQVQTTENPTKPITSLSIAGATSGTVNQTHTFTATVDTNATTPITYTWHATDQKDTSGSDNTMSYTWATEGEKTITVVADNGAGKAVTATHTIQVQTTENPTKPVTSISLAGATSGTVNQTYTFTATVDTNATTPITYTWQATDQQETSGSDNTMSYTWATEGEKTITVTASNSAGESKTATHTITITKKGDTVVPSNTLIYLPIVYR